MEKVSVSKGLLAGIVAVAGASLLAVAFLLGRASGSGGPATPAAAAVGPRETKPPTVVSHPTDAPLAFPAELDAEPGAAPALPRLPAAEPYTAPAASGPVPAPVSPGRASREPERSGVKAYLDTVDAIQAGGLSGDPESLAGSLAAALTQGDASGLDKLIRQTEDARARLVAVQAPAECAAHHRESLGSLDDALEMLRSLKSATESSDPSAALGVVSEQATRLRTRAEALQREDDALRQRYGLKR